MERTAAREAGGCNGVRSAEHWGTPHGTSEPYKIAESWMESEPRWTPHEVPPTSPEVTPRAVPEGGGVAAANDERSVAGAATDRDTPHPGGDEPGAPRDDYPAGLSPEDMARIRAMQRSMDAAAAAVAVESGRADWLARSVVDDIAHGHPDAVLAKMQQLTGEGKLLSSGVRDQLLAAIEQQSEAVAARFARTLATGEALNAGDLSVILDNGKLVLKRDIVSLEHIARALPRSNPWPPDRQVLYIDTRVLVGREHLLLDTGRAIAAWEKVPNVKLVELNSDPIGELPDRLVETSTGRIAQRGPGPLPESRSGLPPLHIVVVEQCNPQPDATARSADDAC